MVGFATEVDMDCDEWEYHLTQIGKLVPMIKRPLVRTIAKRFAGYGEPERANVRWYLGTDVCMSCTGEPDGYTDAYEISLRI